MDSPQSIKEKFFRHIAEGILRKHNIPKTYSGAEMVFALRDERTPSCKMNLKTGVIKDFGGDFSGDCYSLVAYLERLDPHKDFARVLEIACAVGGIAHSHTNGAARKFEAVVPDAPFDWTEFATHYALEPHDFGGAGLTLQDVWFRDAGKECPALLYDVHVPGKGTIVGAKAKSLERFNGKRLSTSVLPGSGWQAGLFGDGLSHCRNARLVLVGGEEKQILIAKRLRFACVSMVSGEGNLKADTAKMIFSAGPSSVILCLDSGEDDHTKKLYEILLEAGFAPSQLLTVRWRDKSKNYDINDLVRDSDEDAARTLIENARPVSALVADEWDEPISLEDPMRSLPEFPDGVLPLWIDRMAQEVSSTIGVPLGFCRTLALGMLSVSMTGKALVRPKAGWLEPCSIWLAPVMVSGGGKSPAFKKFMEPITAYNKQWMKEESAKAATNGERRKELQAALKKARRRADTDPEAQSECERLKLELDGIPSVDSPMPIISDITPAALVPVLRANGLWGNIVDDETGPLERLTMPGSGAPPDINTLLKLWDGGPINNIRKGSPETGMQVFVEQGCTASLVISPQPAVLPAFLSDYVDKRGLTPRLSFSFHQPPLNVPNADKEISASVESVYSAIITKLRAAPWPRQDTTQPPYDKWIFPLTAEAATRFFEWDRVGENSVHRRRLSDMGDLSRISVFGGKMGGKVLRVAGLLAVGDMAIYNNPLEGLKIGLDHIERAIKWMDGFAVPHAIHAYKVMDLYASLPLTSARILLGIIREQAASITKETLRRRTLSELTAKEFAAALAQLESHRHIKIVNENTGGKMEPVVKLSPKSAP